MIDLIKKSMCNKVLSKYGTLDSESIRFKKDDNNDDIKTSFFKDIDYILSCLSYTRYVDKTQVFSNCHNDNITKRVLHVQLVSKVARTIGRALGLNEDLIEAISLGHDVGHVPFGHTGEAILNKISLEHNEGYFMHNVQSVRNFLYLENDGEGLNLSVQVIDGILCHNGEVLEGIYKPIKKDASLVLEEYNNCYKDAKASLKLAPMTLEGCVVRVSDVIAYIGRDIDDAVRMGVINKEEIPKSITNVLGNTNDSIVNTISLDIIKNSINQNYIKMSKEVFDALNELKDFNYKNIYSKANTKDDIANYEKMFRLLFDFYLKCLENNTPSDLTEIFLNSMSLEYKKNTSNERIVIDYIAGMTDNYFLRKYKENIEDVK